MLSVQLHHTAVKWRDALKCILVANCNHLQVFWCHTMMGCLHILCQGITNEYQVLRHTIVVTACRKPVPPIAPSDLGQFCCAVLQQQQQRRVQRPAAALRQLTRRLWWSGWPRECCPVFGKSWRLFFPSRLPQPRQPVQTAMTTTAMYTQWLYADKRTVNIMKVHHFTVLY